MGKRTYISLFHTDPNTGLTKELNFPFDLINKVSVDMNLTVCTSDTIRGRNKTDHAYPEQTKITISGAFGERAQEVLSKEFFNFGKYKLKNVQDLFLSFIKDTRLFYIYTRFKTYKNYVLTGCSFSYSDSASSVSVDFTFVEALFRNNEALYSDTLDNNFKPPVMFAPPLTDALIERPVIPKKEEKTDTVHIDEEKATGDKNLVKEYNNISRKSNGGGYGVKQFERLMM